MSSQDAERNRVTLSFILQAEYSGHIILNVLVSLTMMLQSILVKDTTFPPGSWEPSLHILNLAFSLPVKPSVSTILDDTISTAVRSFWWQSLGNHTKE